MIHPIIKEMVDDDRSYDPWGSTMLALGALCDALSAAGDGSGIPASVGYRPAMGFGSSSLVEYNDTPEDERSGEYDRQLFLLQSWDFEGNDFYDRSAFFGAPLDYDDIVYAIRVLDRYCNVLVRAKRDY